VIRAVGPKSCRGWLLARAGNAVKGGVDSVHDDALCGGQMDNNMVFEILQGPTGSTHRADLIRTRNASHSA
jgi:hypothetical protein